MRKTFKAAFATIVIALIASSIHAQNVNEMVKWTSAEVVHYDVVAEYSGTTNVLLSGGMATPYPTAVKDRFEIAFDWNPLEMTVVGKPVFKNSPSTLPNGTPGRPAGSKPCPQPKMTGAYEHFELVSAKAGQPGSNSLELSVKRTFPGGSIPYALEGPCDIWAASPAKIETLTSGILVPPGMYLAMPASARGGFTLGKDGKSIIVVDKTGWTYTHTLRIVK